MFISSIDSKRMQLFYWSSGRGDDIMLNYQCTGYHDIQTLRETLGVKPIKEFDEWLKNGNKKMES